METKYLEFDNAWRFYLGDAGGAEGCGFNDCQWRVLDLPHDWMIEQQRAAGHPSGSSGGFFPGGVAWYRKHFEAPKAWSHKLVSIEFDGVYHNAEFWLNDHYLGRHPCGYTSFAYALNEHLQFGAGNVLAVRVDVSSAPQSRWYSGAGIYRHVRLVVAETVHVSQWGLRVTTPLVNRKQAVVRLRTEVRNAGGRAAAVSVDWKIIAPDGRLVATTQAEGRVASGATSELAGEVSVADPRLWSPDTPDLYLVQAIVRTAAREVDRETTTFGVRRLHFSAKRGFLLNGEHLLMRGGCVHHDCGPLGSAAIDRAEERKVELLKASGYNAVRCAHNPPSPAFLDACDRLGLLVIDEAFDVWRARKLAYDYHLAFDEWWQRDLESMLRRDHNHPSIVLWSIGNELIERDLPEGAQIARMLSDHVRRIDPSRPVTAGICGIWGNRRPWTDVDAFFESLDVCGYNYLLDVYQSDHARVPERIIVATETYPNKAFEYWRAVETMPWVIGDFVWTALDYLGEVGIGHTHTEGQPEYFAGDYPWLTANCGDIDICGQKRPQSYYRDVVWGRAQAPFIAVHPPAPEDKTVKPSTWGWFEVQSVWNWPGCEQQTLRVDVYSDCDQVELFLNGRSVGRRPAGKRQRYTATFPVPYIPGELRAVGYRGRRMVGESVLETGGPAVALRLKTDRNPIRASRTDLAYVTIEAVDVQGRYVSTADAKVHVTLQGPGSLAAIANADPRSTESFRDSTRRLWRGRVLALVQPTGTPGAIVLNAQADGLQGAAQEIVVGG